MACMGLVDSYGNAFIGGWHENFINEECRYGREGVDEQAYLGLPWSHMT